MPTSHPQIITPVMTKILELQPKRVLDLGIGFGKWGALTREYTDIWAWRFYPNEWQIVIDGVEVHERYKNPNWNHYNKIAIGAVENILPSAGRYGVIVMLEVLEHMKREVGESVLREAMGHTNHFIVSYTNTEQHDVRDNPFEDHVSTWSSADFDGLGDIEVLHETKNGAVLLITKR